MFLELAALGLYVVQQLGVMLGAGAQVIVLVLYLVAIKDGTVDAKEHYFLSATKRILYLGLVCIITSGALITLIHLSQAQSNIVFTPAYLFKWLLILLAVGFALFDFKDQPSLAVIKGLAGAVWFGLFAVHILAPETSWFMLGLLFGTWLLGFMTLWLTTTFMFGGKSLFIDQATDQAPKDLPQPQKQEPPIQLLKKPEPVLEFEPEPEEVEEVEQPAENEVTFEEVVPEPEPQQEEVPEIEPIEVEVEPEPTPPIVVPPPPIPKPLPPIAPPMPKPAFFIPTASTKSPFISSSNDPLALHPHITEHPSLPPAPPPPKAGSIPPNSNLAQAQATEHLPVLRVMPQKPEDLETQHRGPLVRFG